MEGTERKDIIEGRYRKKGYYRWKVEKERISKREGKERKDIIEGR